MSELQRQSDVITVAKAMGGAAHKASNQFLIGVADLVVKLPFKSMWLLEAKLDMAPIRGTRLRLNLTPLQHKFLKDYYAAGAATGVISFVQRKDKLDKAVLIVPFERIVYDDKHMITELSEYEFGKNWKDEIRKQLQRLPSPHPEPLKPFI